MNILSGLLINFEKIQAKYTVANGFRYNADVVYGDTDSVMIRFGCTERDAPIGEKDPKTWMIRNAMETAIEVCSESSTNPHGILLIDQLI